MTDGERYSDGIGLWRCARCLRLEQDCACPADDDAPKADCDDAAIPFDDDADPDPCPECGAVDGHHAEVYSHFDDDDLDGR